MTILGNIIVTIIFNAFIILRSMRYWSRHVWNWGRNHSYLLQKWQSHSFLISQWFPCRHKPIQVSRSSNFLQITKKLVEVLTYAAYYLTHLFPMHPFPTPWKHQKIVRFSAIIRVEKGCIVNRWVKTFTKSFELICLFQQLS